MNYCCHLQSYIVISSKIIFIINLYESDPNADTTDSTDVAPNLLREDVQAALSVDLHCSLQDYRDDGDGDDDGDGEIKKKEHFQVQGRAIFSD